MSYHRFPAMHMHLSAVMSVNTKSSNRDWERRLSVPGQIRARGAVPSANVFTVWSYPRFWCAFRGKCIYIIPVSPHWFSYCLMGQIWTQNPRSVPQLDAYTRFSVDHNQEFFRLFRIAQGSLKTNRVTSHFKTSLVSDKDNLVRVRAGLYLLLSSDWP